MNNNIIQRLIRRSVANGRFVPALVSAVIENEAEIVDLTVVFTRLQCNRITNRQFTPPRVISLLVKYPHHAGQKTVAPVRPCRFCVTPTSGLGVERIEVWIALDKRAHLLLREREGVFNLR